MSGQPVNTQAEVNLKRNEYMETLNLRAQIDDLNLQANKNYLTSGILPATSQMKDTRTTAEKMLDIEKLKLDVVGELKGLYDPAVAMAISNSILNSPLNVDNKLFRFFVQNLPEMVKRLKLKFKYGISGDANDIQQVVEIIQGFYSQSVQTLTSAKTYFDSGLSNDSKSALMKKQDFDTYKENLKIIAQRSVRSKVAFPVILENLLMRLVNEFVFLSENLPSDEVIKASADIAIRDAGDLLAFENDNELHFMSELQRKIPPINIITTNIQILEKAIDSENWRIVEEALNKINGIIYPLVVLLQDLNPQFQQAHELVRRNNETKKIVEREKIKEDQMNRNSVLNAQNVNVVNHPLNVAMYNPQDQGPALDIIGPPPPRPAPDVPVPITRAVMEQIADAIQNQPAYNHTDYFNNVGYGEAMNAIRRVNRARLNDRELFHSIHHILDVSRIPTGIDGYGIKRRGRPKGSGIIREKPKSVKVPNYTDFGTNEINQKSLRDNILTIRRKNRSNYSDLPSRMISPTFQNVIQKIVGGSVPSYNDVSKLSDDEKNYLHRILSKSNLVDKFSVPTPSKDSREKDIHLFEVMKGEIMSGNDSKELIKKFKLLILKLSREGVLPKNEVKDLLTLLVELGY